MPEEYKADFRDACLDFAEADHVADVIADADVIWSSRSYSPTTPKPATSAKATTGETFEAYKITRELLTTKAKSDAILLHSLPRMDEIPADVDITRWSRYWQEAFNGVVMRMALLALVLGKME